MKSPAGKHAVLSARAARANRPIAKAILGILPRTVRVTGGEVKFEGADLLKMETGPLRRLIGERIALIPQDPMTSLNPARRIEAQMTDGPRLWRGLDATAARALALRLLDEVHIREPERVLRSFPHELSGGMRQRVLIAAAFALEPRLIVADEPTTALDVTVQKQILRLIRNMQSAHGTSVVFVTHDLGVVAQICDHVTLLFAGRVIEAGSTSQLLDRPSASLYARTLGRLPTLRSAKCGPVPNSRKHHRRFARRTWPERRAPMSDDLLIARDLEVAFGGGASLFGRAKSPVKVLHGVTILIGRGETVGIVGESGSGKTTLGRALLRLIDVASGTICFDGLDITRCRKRRCAQSGGACS